MKAAGEEIAAEALADRAWAQFSETTVLDDGRWSPDSALRKAHDLLKRVADGEVDIGTGPQPVEPTYPDTTVPLAEAQAATASAVQRFYADAAAWDSRRAEHAAQKKAARAEWRAQRDDWKLDQEALVDGWKPEEGEEAAVKPDPFKFPAFDEPPPVFVLPADVGTGKTHAIGVALAGEGAGLTTALAMPTLRLADEAAKRFRAGSGIEGRVIRGRDALNPEAPGAPQKMCREPEMVAAAIAVGASVQESCCEQKTKDKSGRPVVRRCRHFAVCAYQLQMADAPSVLFSAHQMLAYGHDVFKGVERVIADETFAGALLPDPSRGVSLDEIGAPLSTTEVAALTAYVARTSPFAGPLLDRAVAAARDGIEWRRKVVAAPLRAQAAAGAFGPVLRSVLTAAYGVGFGLTEAICTEAVRDAWQLKPDAQIYPGMPAEERRAAAAASAAIKHVRARAGVMAHLRDFLGMEGEKSGRVFLEKKETDHGVVILVRTRGIDAIAKNFRVPTLAIDATPPAEAVFKTFLPQAETLPRIAVETPHVRVRQVLDAPVSKRKLEVDRNRAAVRRALLDEWIRLDRQPVLVVAQKDFADWLRADGKLPEGMAVEHYGAIAGLDQYKAVRGIVCVGRQQPKPWNVESTAGALTGLYPGMVAVPRADGKSKLPWFNKVQRGIRMGDGSGRAVMVDEHPNPLCEAIRRGVCEDQIVQAIGRGRGVWRTAQSPLDVLILADVCLDLTVAAVDLWQVPGEEVVMAADGVVLDSPSDMIKAWPAIWSSEEAAKKWVQRRTKQARSETGHTGTFPYYDILIGKCPRVRRFRYQHQGERQKWRAGAYDPAAVSAPRAWLEGRLSCQLANFEIHEAAEEDEPEPAAAPAPFLPPAPVVVDNPTAKTAALVGTLGRWLDLMAQARSADVHFRAPLSPVALAHF